MNAALISTAQVRFGNYLFRGREFNTLRDIRLLVGGVEEFVCKHAMRTNWSIENHRQLSQKQADSTVGIFLLPIRIEHKLWNAIELDTGCLILLAMAAL